MSIVAFRTFRGLKFYEIELDSNVKAMHDAILELKSKNRQLAGFDITITDETFSMEMRCQDIWVDHRFIEWRGF